MMLKNIFLFFGISMAMMLLGAGCESQMNTQANLNDNSFLDDAENADTGNDVGGAGVTSEGCEDGMTRYTSSRHNLTFCYPEDDGNGHEVTVGESADGVALSVNGEEMRKIAVVATSENSDEKAEVRKYFDNPTDTVVTCEVVEAESGSLDGRRVYIITGERNGTQTLDAVSACAESDKLQTLVNDHGQAQFIFFDDVNAMYVLSLEQNASLGQMSDEFVQSIEPKERD